MSQVRSTTLVLALYALIFPARMQAQGPILEVRLGAVGTVVVQAEGTEEAPRLPVAPVFELAGMDAPPGAEFISLQALREELGVPVDYRPDRALVVIRDPYSVLPASRALLEKRRAAEGPPMFAFQDGPFATLAARTDGEYRTEIGWSEEFGELAVSNTRGGDAAWRASARPVRGLWFTYRDGSRLAPQFDARLNVGRSFGTISYNPAEQEVGARINSSFGPFTVLVQDQDVTEGVGDGSAVVSWRMRQSLQVTVARTGADRYVGRLSWGRRLSNLSIPRVE